MASTCLRHQIGYPMSIYFSFASLGLGCLGLFALIACCNALLTPRLRHGARWFKGVSSAANLPFVSVLVPARNEAHQIEACIVALLNSDYPYFEVIVADDQSTDGTYDILQGLCERHSQGKRLRVVRLDEAPPAGWTGKARACHNLAQHARGEVLIFCDADVLVTETSLRNTVGCLEQSHAHALTALPSQLGGSVLTQAVVTAVTQVSILVSLPLYLVPRLSSPALATGNGQWFAWRRDVYFACDAHTAVRASRIEDVELGRLVKHSGYKLLVVNASQELVVRMYETLTAARQGFRKNLFALAGESWLAVTALVSLLVILLCAPIWSYLWLSPQFVAVAVCVQGAIILAQRFMFDTSWRVLCCLPVGILMALSYLLESAYWTQRGQIFWKGRAV